jgi:hypothetical protein
MDAGAATAGLYVAERVRRRLALASRWGLPYRTAATCRCGCGSAAPPRQARVPDGARRGWALRRESRAGRCHKRCKGSRRIITAAGCGEEAPTWHGVVAVEVQMLQLQVICAGVLGTGCVGGCKLRRLHECCGGRGVSSGQQADASGCAAAPRTSAAAGHNYHLQPRTPPCPAHRTL